MWPNPPSFAHIAAQISIYSRVRLVVDDDEHPGDAAEAISLLYLFFDNLNSDLEFTHRIEWFESLCRPELDALLSPPKFFEFREDQEQITFAVLLSAGFDGVDASRRASQMRSAWERPRDARRRERNRIAADLCDLNEELYLTDRYFESTSDEERWRLVLRGLEVAAFALAIKVIDVTPKSACRVAALLMFAERLGAELAPPLPNRGW